MYVRFRDSVALATSDLVQCVCGLQQSNNATKRPFTLDSEGVSSMSTMSGDAVDWRRCGGWDACWSSRSDKRPLSTLDSEGVSSMSTMSDAVDWRRCGGWDACLSSRCHDVCMYVRRDIDQSDLGHSTLTHPHTTSSSFWSQDGRKTPESSMHRLLLRNITSCTVAVYVLPSGGYAANATICSGTQV